MRITEKNTPVLRYLKWKKPLNEHPDHKNRFLTIFLQRQDDYGFDKKEAARRLNIIHEFTKNWDKYCPLFTERIDYISNTFYEAMHNSTEKISGEKMLKELAGNTFNGTMIVNKGRMVISYSIKVLDEENINYIMVVHDQMGRCTLAVAENDYFICNSYIETGKERNLDDEGVLGDFWRDIITFHFFLKYAEVEVVESVPYKKVKINKGETMLVDSELKINHIDSTWYRTIIRAEEFGVKGHFRLQPYKNNGSWYKKLIFIQPYIKHGYVRKAKILNDNTTTVSERTNPESN